MYDVFALFLVASLLEVQIQGDELKLSIVNALCFLINVSEKKNRTLIEQHNITIMIFKLLEHFWKIKSSNNVWKENVKMLYMISDKM